MFHSPQSTIRFDDRHGNSFDLLRLVFATMVIFSHTYHFAYGAALSDPLREITGGEMASGTLGLYGFFVTSGFLVAGSYERSSGTLEYLYKRVLRIFPALIVVVLLTMFLIGPLFNSMEPGEYFSERHTWGYLRNLSLYWQQRTLPGIFPGTPDFEVANSNLWTLPQEFTWYLLLIPFALAGLLRRPLILLGIGSGLFALTQGLPESYLDFTLPILSLHFRAFLVLGMYFIFGMTLYAYRERLLRIRGYWLWLTIPLMGLTAWAGAVNWTFPFLFPLTVLLLAMMPGAISRFATQIGDASYGMYIWGFPVQLMMFTLLGNNWHVCFWSTVLTSLAIGLLSWHFVERPAMKRLSYAHIRTFFGGGD